MARGSLRHAQVGAAAVQVRTEDPWEANLFFVPALLLYSARECRSSCQRVWGRDGTDRATVTASRADALAGRLPGAAGAVNAGNPTIALRPVVEYIKQAWPFFNRTGGADHFLWMPGDFGACEISEQVGAGAGREPASKLEAMLPGAGRAGQLSSLRLAVPQERDLAAMIKITHWGWYRPDPAVDPFHRMVKVSTLPCYVPIVAVPRGMQPAAPTQPCSAILHAWPWRNA